MERLFCLSNVQICAVPAASNSINYITLLMPGWCFVLRVDKFLPQCVVRFKMNCDMMFIVDPPECLRCSCSIENEDVVRFSCLLVSACSGSFSGFDKGPILVAIGFKCSPDLCV